MGIPERDLMNNVRVVSEESGFLAERSRVEGVVAELREVLAAMRGELETMRTRVNSTLAAAARAPKVKVELPDSERAEMARMREDMDKMKVKSVESELKMVGLQEEVGELREVAAMSVEVAQEVLRIKEHLGIDRQGS